MAGGGQGDEATLLPPHTRISSSSSSSMNENSLSCGRGGGARALSGPRKAGLRSSRTPEVQLERELLSRVVWLPMLRAEPGLGAAAAHPSSCGACEDIAGESLPALPSCLAKGGAAAPGGGAWERLPGSSLPR